MQSQFYYCLNPPRSWCWQHDESWLASYTRSSSPMINEPSWMKPHFGCIALIRYICILIIILYIATAPSLYFDHKDLHFPSCFLLLFRVLPTPIYRPVTTISHLHFSIRNNSLNRPPWWDFSCRSSPLLRLRHSSSCASVIPLRL